MASLEQAIDQMYAAGMPPLPQGLARVDGRLHRYGPKGEGPSGRAYYKLYDYQARNGRRYIAGYFGRWSDIPITKIRTDFAGIEPDELRRLQAAQTQQEVREREKREQRARFAGNRARQQWDAARARLDPGQAVPYLERKKIAWEKGLRVFTDGTLVVPMVRYDVTEEQAADPAYTGPQRLVGLQKIPADGKAKRYSKGAAVQGAMCRFGAKPKDGELFLLGEGLATVLACHQSLERAYTSWVAFDAGNLAPAAEILRRLYPNSPVLFLADDDAYLEAQLNAELAGSYGARELYKVLDAERVVRTREGEITVHAHVHDDPRGTPVLTAGVTKDGQLRTILRVNTGRNKAWEAAGRIGNAWVAWPEFVERALSPDPAAPRYTDWNDLALIEGADPLVRQLGAALKSIEDARELARSLKDGVPARDKSAPREQSGAGGGKGGDDEPDWELHGSLLRRFTLIYGSDCAYDDAKARIVKVPHLRLAFGAASVNRWLASPRRRTIDPEQIVFDPTGKADREKTVNLFRGIDVKPKFGECSKLLQLLQYVCGEEESDQAPITTWVLKWCAYPLQHLGAKMQTAVVMHGEEGAGKNLFWGAIGAIYGRHGGMITQRDLEDRFNEWLSAKLFVIANEVVTRQEMSHHVGFLKNLITEPVISVRRMYTAAVSEANHMNLVFLSNELQALKIGPRDRRYMVIRTPNPRREEFYAEVGAELSAGGAAALYRYLLDLDLGDFNPHTKPLMTEAKAAMIDIGLFPSQLFWRDLHDGMLGLPYTPALVEDVYRAYQAWCFRNGHKMPEALNRFSPNFMSLNGVRRVDKRVPDPGKPGEMALAGTSAEAELRVRKVFLMGEPKADPNEERQRVVRGVSEFRKSLGEFLSDSGGAGFGPGSRAARQEEAL
jgi:putative DNA primase/helicase